MFSAMGTTAVQTPLPSLVALTPFTRRVTCPLPPPVTWKRIRVVLPARALAVWLVKVQVSVQRVMEAPLTPPNEPPIGCPRLKTLLTLTATRLRSVP